MKKEDFLYILEVDNIYHFLLLKVLIIRESNWLLKNKPSLLDSKSIKCVMQHRNSLVCIVCFDKIFVVELLEKLFDPKDVVVYFHEFE